MDMKKENLLGREFNRLTVIAEVEHPSGRTAWLCQCTCGNTKVIKSEELKSGGTQSCGCLNNEKRKERAPQLYGSCVKFHPSETTARRVWKKRYSDGDISYDDFLCQTRENSGRV